MYEVNEEMGDVCKLGGVWSNPAPILSAYYELFRAEILTTQHSILNIWVLLKDERVSVWLVYMPIFGAASPAFERVKVYCFDAAVQRCYYIMQ